MSADTFLERLISLLPRPRTNQVIYRGVLAAHSARRPHVVSEPDDDERHRPRNATFCDMKHGLAIDVLACPCGHRMKYAATILAKNPDGYCGHGGTGTTCPIGLVPYEG